MQQNKEYLADSFAAGWIQQLKTAINKGSFSETFLRVSPDFLAGDLYRALTYGRSEFEVNRDILGFFNGRHTFLSFQIFNYIINHQEDQLVAISFDIEGFFDNLDHKLLQKTWYEILDKKTLPKAEYNIFNNITNFLFINKNQIFNAFKDEIIVESKTGIHKRKQIKKFHHLKNQGAIAFCELTEFKKIKANKLIVGNHHLAHPKRIKGIPQGTPISAALANVYMIDFDYKVYKYVKNLKGLYRRYSDDMIVICEAGYIKAVVDMFDLEIAERKLDIQHDKT